MSANFIPNPTLRGTDPIDALRLIRSENVGPMTFFHLVKFCGSVKKALEMAPDISRRGGRKRAITVASKAEVDGRELAEPATPMPDESTLTSARAALLEALSASPTKLDDLIAATGLTPHLMLAVLLELELAGRLERQAGGTVALRMGE